MSDRQDREIVQSPANERLRDIAAILAEGVLRLHSRAALVATGDQASGAENSPNSSLNCLELPSESRLSGPHGLTARETQRPEVP
jgi:hypothetical protein